MVERGRDKHLAHPQVAGVVEIDVAGDNMGTNNNNCDQQRQLMLSQRKMKHAQFDLCWKNQVRDLNRVMCWSLEQKRSFGSKRKESWITIQIIMKNYLNVAL